MNKLLPVLAISALLLTGCSTSVSEYDEIHKIQYERCLDTYDRFNPIQSQGKNAVEFTADAIEACEGLKPLKK